VATFDPAACAAARAAARGAIAAAEAAFGQAVHNAEARVATAAGSVLSDLTPSPAPPPTIS
jgi:hypothetical protein